MLKMKKAEPKHASAFTFLFIYKSPKPLLSLRSYLDIMQSQHACGTYKIILEPKAQGETSVREGTFLTVFMKQAEGSWKIYPVPSLISSTDPFTKEFRKFCDYPNRQITAAFQRLLGSSFRSHAQSSHINKDDWFLKCKHPTVLSKQYKFQLSALDAL